jgi:MFS family permease
MQENIIRFPTEEAIPRGRFAVLSIRNYRLNYIGQGISSVGTWLQNIALNLYVAKITHGSAVQVGIVSACQLLPLLVFGMWAGVLVDRLDKRRTLLCTQSIASILALTLGLLVRGGLQKIWAIDLLALALGMTLLVDNPARQSFVPELIGNSKSLNINASFLETIQINLARFVGPLLGISLVMSIGFAWCFIINSASYVAVLITLCMLRTDEIHRHEKSDRGDLKEGLDYIRSSPEIRNALIMTAIVGTFLYEFQVSFLAFAHMTFHNDKYYGYMLAATGVGAIYGGFKRLHRQTVTVNDIANSTLGLGISVFIAASMPNLPMVLLVLVSVGFFSVGFVSMGRGFIRSESPPHLRARIIVFWTMGFMGSTPPGALLIGFIAQYVGPRPALYVGALAAILSGLKWRVRSPRLVATPAESA